MDTETITLDRINPLHRVREPAKLAVLTAAFAADGWTGRPVLGELCSDGYTVRLWTGSHRYAAAKAAGLDEIPVALIDTDGLSDDYEPRNGDGLGECYRDSMPEDDAKLAEVLRYSDPEAADLFALDAEPT